MNKKNINFLLDKLKIEYPQAKTELNYSNAFELLIATILSAQTTDKQVNKVTAELFRKYKKVEDFIKLEKNTLEKEINSIGLYKNKSKYIIDTCKMLLKNYNGEVPNSREELIKLPGVGRKTANVLLSCIFNKNAIAVDTHVFRLANRIGIVSSKNFLTVEKALMEQIPEENWSEMHHCLIYHGRRVCKARNPQCENCVIAEICQYYKNRKEEK
ncbi:endonuclease III [Natronospora cellulosivora (SeqCode)]